MLSAGNLRDCTAGAAARGLDGRGGLDRLAERIRRLRAAGPAARRPGRHPGPGPGRAGPGAGRRAGDAAAGLDGDDARFAEMELDTLPDDVAGAVRALD